MGFFLPGDSLLFTAGLLSATGRLPALPIMLPTIAVAAIVGDQVGYLIGRKSGPAVFNRPDSRFFSADNVERARGYFDRHGPRTVVIARFLPVVRSFVPVMAGAARMDYRTFCVYNVVGGIGWAVSVTTLGHYLGRFAFVRSNIELIIIAVLAVAWIPLVFELIRVRRRGRAAPARPPADQRAS